MPREKEFQRKKKDTRMPVRDSHAEERMDTRQSEQDFNLLRVRDAPSSLGTARSRRYETAAQQAADDTQPFKADVPQQADISIPEHLESRDMDHEPARAPETRNPLEPGTSAPEPRRRAISLTKTPTILRSPRTARWRLWKTARPDVALPMRRTAAI